MIFYLPGKYCIYFIFNKFVIIFHIIFGKKEFINTWLYNFSARKQKVFSKKQNVAKRCKEKNEIKELKNN